MSQNEHLRFGKSLDIMNHIIERNDFLTLKKKCPSSTYQLTVCADDEVTMVFLREFRAKWDPCTVCLTSWISFCWNFIKPSYVWFDNICWSNCSFLVNVSGQHLHSKFPFVGI